MCVCVCVCVCESACMCMCEGACMCIKHETNTAPHQDDPCGSQGPRQTQQKSALQFWFLHTMWLHPPSFSIVTWHLGHSWYTTNSTGVYKTHCIFSETWTLTFAFSGKSGHPSESSCDTWGTPDTQQTAQVFARHTDFEWNLDLNISFSVKSGHPSQSSCDTWGTPDTQLTAQMFTRHIAFLVKPGRNHAFSIKSGPC